MVAWLTGELMICCSNSWFYML